MEQKVFLDIGGHMGESLAAALETRWRFDRIVTFEPAPPCWPALEALADDRTEVCRFGLWTEDTTLTLHDPGEFGASIHSDKARTTTAVECDFRDAAGWFRANLSDDDLVYAKINIEGAECDLLDHLLEADQLRRVDHLAVYFDVSKVPSMAHREAETRARLDASGVPFVSADDDFFGIDDTRRVSNWLAWCEAGPVGRLRFPVMRQAYRVRRKLWELRERP